MTMNSGDSSNQLAETFGAGDNAKPCPAVPTLQEAAAVGNTSDGYVDEQSLGALPGGNILCDIPLPNAPLPEACPGGSACEE
jgi:hypothetical protein